MLSCIRHALLVLIINGNAFSDGYVVLTKRTTTRSCFKTTFVALYCHRRILSGLAKSIKSGPYRCQSFKSPTIEMAMKQLRSRLNGPPPPPPSPIPTAKGSRSAPTSPLFTQFLQQSLYVPDLSFPSSSGVKRHHIPADITYSSLVSGLPDAINLILDSAQEFGAFRICDHGISADDFRSLAQLTQCVPGKEVVWVRCWNHITESTQRQKSQHFSENMDKIARKFDSIAELLLQLLLENADNQSEMKIQHKESVLSLCRYNHQGSIGKNEYLQNEINPQPMDHALSIHLPLGLCQFSVQSTQGSFCFDTGPDSLVVIVGKNLEEQSLNKYKCLVESVMLFPKIHRTETFFSIEQKFSATSPDNNLQRNCKAISICEQIILCLIMAFLYKICVFISSQITGA